MNVTREIVKDLLPLYVSGEASADSRAVVEEHLRGDPELSRLADALRAEALAPVGETPVSPASGREALLRTKTLLRRRTWSLALAWFFTGLPLSFAFDSSGLRFLLIRDVPAADTASLALGLALWAVYAVTARRLRVSGLWHVTSAHPIG